VFNQRDSGSDLLPTQRLLFRWPTLAQDLNDALLELRPESNERHHFLCCDPTTDRHASRDLGGDPILVRTEAAMRDDTDELL
jgi:hypothetical protein